MTLCCGLHINISNQFTVKSFIRLNHSVYSNSDQLFIDVSYFISFSKSNSLLTELGYCLHVSHMFINLPNTYADYVYTCMYIYMYVYTHVHTYTFFVAAVLSLI